MSKALLITGATGRQGGSVVRALRRESAQFEILAVTRDTESASAKRLQNNLPNITLISGDLDDPRDIFKKAKDAAKTPIWGVFSVQGVAQGDKSKEERQGKALVDAAIENDVKMFVYSSVDRGGEASSKNPTDIPHFASKHNIEQHLFHKAKTGGLKWTILRPVAFMENLVPGFAGKVWSTSLQITLGDEKPVQLVATSDIGFFAAQAFLNPESYNGLCLSLAGDELRFSEYKRTFEEHTGEKLATTYTFLCSMLLWANKEFGVMLRWFRTDGYGANIPELTKLNPQMMNFGTWLEKESAWRKGAQ